MPTTTINLTGQALSKTDDTNVTLTLGGTPATALLKATSITVGWTGTLADARIASAATWNAKESALTFSTGLTRTVNTITIDGTVVTLTGAQALSNKTGLISQWTNDSGYLTSLAGAVTSVTASGNIASSGGATPNITFTGVLPIANGGLNLSSLGTALQQIRVNAGATALEYFTPAASGSTLSGLTAATATNSINNVNYAQVWSWNSLTTEIGLTLSSSSISTGSINKIISTSTVGNAAKGLEIAISGANSTGSKTNYGQYTAITNTGTTSTNVGGYFSASGGTTNLGLVVAAGDVAIGGTAPTHFNNYTTLSINGTTGSILDFQESATSRFQIYSSGNQLLFFPVSAGGGGYLCYSGTTGNFGIGSNYSGGATARLHIMQGGTASASTAPLKFTSGTNLTTPETGAMEYNGTNLFFTRSGTTRESVITANTVNVVSPTSPNRTITVVIDGTTYYIAAKTTND